jgi:hypothetical protein
LPSGYIVSLRKPERHPVIRLNALCQELPGHVRVDTSMSSSCDFLAPFPSREGSLKDLVDVILLLLVNLTIFVIVRADVY